MFLNKELSDFIHVANFENFSKASDYLGVQQSGLSKSIKRLEIKYGKKLFIRQAKGLELTEVGRLLRDKLKDVERVETEFSQTLDQLEFDIAGSFKIGVHPVIGKFIIPKIKKELSNYPGIKCEFIFAPSKLVTEQVLNSEIDFAVVASPKYYPDLRIKKLWKEFVGLYSKDGKMKPELIFHSKMVGVKPLLKTYERFSQQRIDDYDIIYSILKRTPSMGLLPNPVGDKESRLKLIQKCSEDIDVCLIYRTDSYQSKGFKTLRDIINLY